jgi:hypothetical protein
MFTLIMYTVIAGKMQTTRLPMPDEATCASTAAQLAPIMKPVHHECRPKKIAAKKAEA